MKGKKWIYYEAAADGAISPDPLPIDGQVIGIDEEGYVTLYREVDVAVPNAEYAEQEKAVTRKWPCWTINIRWCLITLQKIIGQSLFLS